MKKKKTLIGEIPEDWEIRRVENILDVINPKVKPIKTRLYENEGKYPIIDQGQSYIAGFYNITSNVFKGKLPVIVFGDHTKEIKFVDFPFVIGSSGVKILRPKNDENIRFLYYALHKVRIPEKNKGYARHAGVLLKQNMILPPIKEQQKIAEILSAVDKGIQKVDEAIEKTERLKKGLMQKLLTEGIGHKEFKNTKIGKIPEDWEIKKICDLFKVETGTTPSTKNKSYWEKGNINWFTPADFKELNNEIYVKNSTRKITRKALKESNLTLMPKNSIVLSTRAPVGYVVLLKEPATFNQGCKGLIPKKNNISTEFYTYYIKNQKYKLQNRSSGSTFSELSKTLLKNFPVPLLKFKEQQKIAKILSTVDKKLQVQKKQKNKLERIKQGLMNDLLTGKKRVKV